MTHRKLGEGKKSAWFKDARKMKGTTARAGDFGNSEGAESTNAALGKLIDSTYGIPDCLTQHQHVYKFRGWKDLVHVDGFADQHINWDNSQQQTFTRVTENQAGVHAPGQLHLIAEYRAVQIM